MQLDEGWMKVLTIVMANLGVFLWATRQARSDYLHMDKKFEDNRKEMNQIMKEFSDKIDKIIERNDERISRIEEGRK